MKAGFKKLLKFQCAVLIISLLLSACTATVKVPKHPNPGEPPPPPPKVEIHNN